MPSRISSPGRPASVALAVGLLFFAAAAPLRAAGLEADSRITAVTVFPDRAQVTRLIEVPLPQGDTTVVVSGLPASLLGDSLRVEGAGSTRLRLGAVEARTRHGRTAAREEERRLKAEIEALGDRKRLVTDRIAALKFKQGVIEAIGVAFLGTRETRDEDGSLAYHYTLVDFLAEWRAGVAAAGGDAAEVAWADPDHLAPYDLWDETLRVIALARP